LGLDLLHPGGDHLDRLIPADALPLAFALLAHADERIVEAAGMVELLDGGSARLRAQRAAVDRVIAVADHLLDRAVDALDDGSAAAVAHPANGLELLDDVLAQRTGFSAFSLRDAHGKGLLASARRFNFPGGFEFHV